MEVWDGSTGIFRNSKQQGIDFAVCRWVDGVAHGFWVTREQHRIISKGEVWLKPGDWKKVAELYTPAYDIRAEA